MRARRLVTECAEGARCGPCAGSRCGTLLAGCTRVLVVLWCARAVFEISLVICGVDEYYGGRLEG